MKTIYKILIALTVAFFAVSCGKDIEFNDGISLSNESVNMPAVESWHVIAVYANSDWTARLSKEVEWAKIDVESGKTGLGRIQIDCEENRGLKRAVDLIVTDGVHEDVLHIYQVAGVDTPVFEFVKTSLEVSSNKATIVTAFNTNLEQDLGEVEVKVCDTAGNHVDWINHIEVQKDKVYFGVSSTDLDRVAVITLSLIDGDGVIYETSLSVTQKAALN